MRLTTLLLLMIALLLLTAPAASFAQNAVFSKTDSSYTGDAAAILRPDGSSPASPAWKLDSMNSQAVCYTMRTYVAVRDEPRSDTTHIAGYHECLPSWKLEMRSSEQKNLEQRKIETPRP
jgi:hypothetical protein